MTPADWREVIAHLAGQGFVVESVDRDTGRIVLRVPDLRATETDVTSQQTGRIGTAGQE